MTRSDPPPALTAAHFQAVLGTTFRLTAAGQGGGAPVLVDLELAEVTGYADSPAGPLREPFSVVFHGPAGPVLPQGIYPLEHERMGALELFLVPIGPAGPGTAASGPATQGEQPAAMRYEAVFG